VTAPLRRPVFDAIPDERVREFFQWFYEFLSGQPLLLGRFEHFEIEVTQAETGLLIPHNLGFVPLDILPTSVTGPGTVTFNYTAFTENFISITTTGACKVRFFGGSYVNENV